MYKSIKELFTAIADVIRERLGIEGKIPTQDIPNRVLDLFFTGFTQGRETGEKTGYTQGLAKGKEQGKQAQYDEFWDAFQGADTLRPYQYGNTSWNDANFYPKYDLYTKKDNNIWAAFYYINVSDFSGRIKELGLKFDTSKAARITSLFAGASCTKIPLVSALSAIDANFVFNECINLITIEGFEVHENLTYNDTFKKNIALENLTIIGTIGQSGINLQWSTKLSKASIISIITHLSDTASGKSITISKTAVNNGFETSAGAADGSTSEEWVTLITAKSNWTINLIDA